VAYQTKSMIGTVAFLGGVVALAWVLAKVLNKKAENKAGVQGKPCQCADGRVGWNVEDCESFCKPPPKNDRPF